MADPSSSSFLRSYDVFLSFRGEDTRNSFTAHLYEELHTKGINTFIDDDKLERGDVISSTLVVAIENSKFSVIVLSENYASSRWCLEELVKILECMRTRGQRVLPIFYNVDPSHVRYQKENLDKHLLHMKKKEEYGEGADLEGCLTQVANLSGWDSRNQHERMLIKEIATYIWNKLFSRSPNYAENLVGIESSLREVKSLLCTESLDVRMVGIWGMGGIGKTTLARAVYGEISHQFEACCFLKMSMIISNNKGTEKVEAISLDLSSLEEINFTNETFARMNRLGFLRFMNLKHSIFLTETPDFSRVTNLKRLVLKGCISLYKVHPSLGDLNKLNFLNLKNCKMLNSLPRSICDLKCLEIFILSGCSKFEELPENFGNLEMLEEFYADGTAIRDGLLVPALSAVIFGSRIPDWIRYQSSGSEVKAELPPNWYNSNFLGLALSCTLFYSTSNCASSSFDVYTYPNHLKGKVESDHLWLVYVPLPRFINWNQVTHIKASFRITTFMRLNAIKECGIGLVYVNEEVNYSIFSPPNVSSVVLQEIHEGPSGSRYSNIDGSESENSDYYSADEGEPIAPLR
ncbi:hypothetical protein AAG906_017771 [Vitis piasezkii]